MIKVPVYNVTGKKVTDQELSSAIFGVSIKPQVVHQVVVAQQANSRVVLAHTKTKGEVRGGGKKPWKQKGTGRARAGSSRSPLWRGGGIIFGPRKTRNFSQKVNKKVKNLALRMVLTDKVANDRLVMVDQLVLPAGKTKQLQAVLCALPTKDKKSLMVLGKNDVALVRAARNLANVGYLAANSLNVVDLLSYDYIVADQAAIQQIEAVYGKQQQ